MRAVGDKRVTDWAFNHYLKIAHPSFAQSVWGTGIRETHNRQAVDWRNLDEHRLQVQAAGETQASRRLATR
jgi:hypothetical protein